MRTLMSCMPPLPSPTSPAQVPSLIDFVSSLGMNLDPAEVDEEVMKSAINLLGDVASCMPVSGRALPAPCA